MDEKDPVTPRYVVVTLSDARSITTALEVLLDTASIGGGERANLTRIKERLRHETGANIQEIVDGLVKTDVCAACNIEGQARTCVAHEVTRLGRRLRRLLERAREER